MLNRGMSDEDSKAERERLQRMLDASERMGSEGGYADRVAMIQKRLAELNGD